MNKEQTDDFKKRIDGLGERTRCAAVLEITQEGTINAFYNGPINDLIVLQYYLGKLIDHNTPKVEPGIASQTSNPPEDQL